MTSTRRTGDAVPGSQTGDDVRHAQTGEVARDIETRDALRDTQSGDSSLEILSDPPAGIRAAGIDYRYGRVLALHDVDLVVAAGDVIALLGPNGAGKTTLLEVIAALRRPESGTVSIDGIDARKCPTLARRGMGYVGHRNGHFPNLTCTENLALFAGFHDMAVPSRAVEAAIDAVGLSAWAARPASTLSHGAARRLAIARAILHSPSVLIFDEPYSGLDPSSAGALDELIGALAREGRSILMATHDVDRALEISHHLVRLEQGRIVWSAAAPDVDRAMLLGLQAPAGRPLTVGAGRNSGVGAQGVEPKAQRDAQGPLFRAAFALARKDLAIEWRARRTLPATIVYSLIVTTLFAYAFSGGPEAMRSVAPGVLWVALLFGAMPGLARSMYADAEAGALDSIRMSPIDRGAIFFGPWLSTWLMSVATACVLMPALFALLRIPAAGMPALIGIAALGLAGWAAAGVLTSAMAASARTRELLLPVLLLPLVLPLILAAVTATAGVLGDPSADVAGMVVDPNAQIGLSLIIVSAYDVVFIVAGFLLLPFVLEA